MALRCLHIVGQLGFGGITTWLKTLVMQAPREELAIDICCNFRLTEGELADEFRQMGCSVFHAPLSFNLFAYSAGISKILRQGNHQIIHDHRGILSGATLRAGHKCGVPVRIMYHHTPDDELLKGALRNAYAATLRSWALKHATHIWGCSKAVLMGQYGENWEQGDPRLGVMYGTVAPREPAKDARCKVRSELGLNESAKLICFVGRVNYQKNVEVAMTACVEVLRQETCANVLWIGEGPFLEKVKAIAKASKNAGRISFFGFRKDIPDILQAADVLFMPSRFEGLPLLVLEALQAGISLVVSNTPGILEALPASMHERCAAPNDIDAHVKNIMDVLRQPQQRIIPEDFLREFSGKAFYQRILRAYQQSLEE